MRSSLQRVAIALLVLALSACAASPGYYWQAASGQFELWRKATPVDQLLARPDTPDALRQRLKRVSGMRSFASRELGLPDNDSYRSYADLERRAVVWNVVAAPALSMQTKQWCFWVAGCVGYLGYFSEEGAQAYAKRLRDEGMDVYVGPVPAYSTLGWFDDPVLNTFIDWSDAELAGLIFHELAHQLIYAPGDTEFNESFAVSVEEAGVQRWLAQQGKTAPARDETIQQDFAALVTKYRDLLAALYARSDLNDTAKLAHKGELIAQMRADYARMRDERWAGYRGYERWFGNDLNNAKIASVGYYHGLLPGFRKLLEVEQGDLPRYYERVRALAKETPEARRKLLAGLSASP